MNCIKNKDGKLFLDGIGELKDIFIYETTSLFSIIEELTKLNRDIKINKTIYSAGAISDNIRRDSTLIYYVNAGKKIVLYLPRGLFYRIRLNIDKQYDIEYHWNKTIVHTLLETELLMYDRITVPYWNIIIPTRLGIFLNAIKQKYRVYKRTRHSMLKKTRY